MTKNRFFQSQGPFTISDIAKNLGLQDQKLINDNFEIKDIQNLNIAEASDITFFNSQKYKKDVEKTKAEVCITTDKLEKYLPKNCKKIIVKEVLYALALVSKMFYPKADLDYLDLDVETPDLKKYKNVKFGKNVFIGKNVEIGENSTIGNNSIIESNVKIGKNCVVGSDVTLKCCEINESVRIQDGCKLGIKGFGFIPLQSKNIPMPHIGSLLIMKNVEIGSCCTIDRGSMGNTIIGENTYVDNQVHIAHNVVIGKNCIIAGQVGFAGSSKLGDNVRIGGQAGISGHLSIGNNVSIGGGSGVVKNIPDNSKVMGYPATDMKDFVKKLT